ncbi:UNVERIFIED_ORG: glycerol dehydrogenase [Clostridium botulinum]|uniref:glycerol dehydrogenase n=1 Tax=Clostridium botulinum TaxID=1491 RepID=UPI000174E98B|nr:glycerol dehydrogenase [Clostridium botulinum]ACD52742.1 glycerol dehydrogenase [Clostridium botulinum E3 str. Alaska E43]AJF28970.1 glycerol dehydrogenase [Clostridium botulinum]AJF32031.1 glycerol dehydrogenase [Clostridium botulinum]MBN1034771.1 glycerol dehydrogenase [Clostridium botulinum]MBN1047955.1 glycerol dehydrogenase [Clostridium botulinum]
MANIIISPGKYVQGNGELENIATHTKNLGDNFFVIISTSGMKRVSNTIKNSFSNSDENLTFEIFNGECSETEIMRLQKSFKDNNCNVVIGIGGGKILDTAKAVAYYEDVPVVIAPTIASTDAPCSALSVIYTDNGIFDKYLILKKNPDVVLLDTKIIVNAPSRLLISGMGDALATYFEARACRRANSLNLAGGHITLAAETLAHACYKTLLSEGYKAKLAVNNNVVTKAVENIVEATTLLSGLGFESGGLAAAHAIHNGFTILKECHDLYHGEKVAFGTITQLVLENAPIEEIREVINFCRLIGLPTNLSEMGIKNIDKDDIMRVAEACCAENETIHNMPFEVTTYDVYAAILTANKLGKS